MPSSRRGITTLAHMPLTLCANPVPRIKLLPAAALAALAACTAPTRGYDGPALPDEEVAVVTGRSESQALAEAFSPQGTSRQPTIEVYEVNGRSLPFVAQVEVPAGSVELLCRLQGVLDGQLDATTSYVRVAFDAVGGEGYRLTTMRSEHQWPWSLRVTPQPKLTDWKGPSPIASSEPEFSDLRLPPRPDAIASWSASQWRLYADGESAVFEPSPADGASLFMRRAQLDEGDAPRLRKITDRTRREQLPGAEVLVDHERGLLVRGEIDRDGVPTRAVGAWWVDGASSFTASFTCPSEVASNEVVDDVTEWLAEITRAQGPDV